MNLNNENNFIKLAISDFTDTPGARYQSQGEHSSEEFCKKFLIPKFDSAIKENKFLKLNLENLFGLPHSFFSCAIATLIDLHGKEAVQNKLVLDLPESHFYYHQFTEFTAEIIASPQEFRSLKRRGNQ